MADPPGYLLFLAFISYVSLVVGNTIDAVACLNLGFTKDLMCGSCDKLEQFGLQKITDSCQQCCYEDENEGQQKLPHAELRICS